MARHHTVERPFANRSSTPPVDSDLGLARTGSGGSGSGSELKSFNVQMKTTGVFGGDAEGRALPMLGYPTGVKARGERSFTEMKSDGKPLMETTREKINAGQTKSEGPGGVRRVLSEIKQHMAESSRIIADQTFQQAYEMVPGDRGILGEGINGPVRMARRRKDGKEVAVKRISCTNLSEQRRQMLVSEVSIFLQVSHRNIVQLLEVYESDVDQAVLLIMELCTGRELFERLAERRWYSEFDAARVSRQMLDAVSYLHSQNICHRDLKLENWLYESPDAEAKLKLCDFGFGQIVEPSVQLTATLGSLFYVAPEVLEGSYGLPCDMWSVGVIVYMLLSGVPPFDGKTDADVTSKIKNGRFVSTGKRWEGISETAKHFVRSLLRKDPYERLAAAEAAQHAWLKMDQSTKATWPKGSPDAEFELPIDRGVIRDMWKFAQNNAITRAALGIFGKLQSSTSTGGREEDVMLLDQKFRSYDEQGTGKISAGNFIQVLKDSLQVQISSAEEKQFFERIAGNLPGNEEEDASQAQKKIRRREVNYREFIELTKARRMANNTAAIREAFRAFDEKGDGYIKEDDMHTLLGDEFKNTIDNYVDLHGKDVIDYTRFANIVSKEMALKDDQESESLRKPSRSFEQVENEGEAAAVTLPQISSPGGSAAITEVTTSGNGEGRSSITSQPGASPTHSMKGPEAEEVKEAAVVRANSKEEDLDNKDKVAKEAEAEQAAGDAEAAAQQAAPNQVAKAAQEEYEEEEDEHEECDADAESDEEQLMNVKGPSESDVVPPEKGIVVEEDKSQKESVKPSKGEGGSQRFAASFSLSLAGSSEYDDSFGVNRVLSMPSDVYHIKQMPGFHSRILKPFYAARPVSNVVMGLIRGTSLYAKQSVKARLATIIHTNCGWFFIMPNPKYHTEVDSRKGLLSKETGKFRFVAWWIHPRFQAQLRQWFHRLTSEDKEQAHKPRVSQAAGAEDAGMPPIPAAAGGASGPAEKETLAPAVEKTERSNSTQGQTEKEPPQKDGGLDAKDDQKKDDLLGKERGDDMMGSPGDFRFSDVPKPDSYLHTYRDLHSKEHVNMLLQLREGTHRFLRSLFDENFMAQATINAGFHYPVRTQYATLHMQVRVNSGSVCREDGRGIEVDKLIDIFKRDRTVFERDSETVRYQVTENVKVSLLAAAQEYEAQNEGAQPCRQLTGNSYELGAAAMPSIHEGDFDEGDEEEDDEGSSPAAATASPERKRTESPPSPAQAPVLPGMLHDRKDDYAYTPQPDGDRSLMSATGDQSSVSSSYLVNLQPSVGSRFNQIIYKLRRRAREQFGADSTHLYPLHISVTGFFEAPESIIRRLVTGMQDLLRQSDQVADSALEVRKVVCTSSGYVLYDVHAPSISHFSRSLNTWSKDLGLNIRSKAVNHISLACDRNEAVLREKVGAIFEGSLEEDGGAEFRDARRTATFDLVLSRLLHKATFHNFAQEGPHRFLEVARIPVFAKEQEGIS
eukprot:TRINITY_DN23702_c0_g2_i1.p1 TRINITY_DN23702_c0_g2~~TRINITY_DN23702_c0_g2_i1.p1  ORF type:complete len:1742 (+),score=437.49 TRINITY_DN23702_c0_g2_i1:785-5227(+)